MGFCLAMPLVYFALNRIYIVSQSRQFYDVPQIFIAYARPFQALAAILDWSIQLASISYWYRFDVRQYEHYLDYLKLLYCEFQNYEVMTMSLVDGQPKKPANPSYKATKHIKHAFLISDCYEFLFHPLFLPEDKLLFTSGLWSVFKLYFIGRWNVHCEKPRQGFNIILWWAKSFVLVLMQN